jgi:2-keto-3-deoxy-L-rhamnonate aldolase RhmA
MMDAKTLKQKLVQGDTVYGTIIQHLTNPAIVDVIPEGTLDFVVLTSEHSALDLAEFLPLRYALASKGIASLVRIHSRDPADVSKVCDTYDGVVIPYAEDFENIRRLAAAAVYRPLKGKVLEKVLTDRVWPSAETEAYIEEKNADTVFIPMIESVPAVEDLDRICSIPGVHAVFVGPGDLTANMGIPRKYDDPKLISTLQKIIERAETHHVAAGCWFGEEAQALRTIKQGARLVVFSNDGLLLGNAIKAAFEALRGS